VVIPSIPWCLLRASNYHQVAWASVTRCRLVVGMLYHPYLAVGLVSISETT